MLSSARSGDLAGGWLIRYMSTGFTTLQLLSWLTLWVGYGGMVVAAMWEMWGNPSSIPLPMRLPGRTS